MSDPNGTGITTAVLRPGNPNQSGVEGIPDVYVYDSIPNCSVTRNDGGVREKVRGLPASLPVSPHN